MPDHSPSLSGWTRRTGTVLATLVLGGSLVVAPAPPGQSAPSKPTTTVTDLPIQAAAPSRQRLATSDTGASESGSGRVVAALPAKETDRFSTLGVTWAASPEPDPVVEVRIKQGTWGDWQQLEPEEAAGSDREGTAPVHVGDATGVQVRLLAADSGTSATPSDVRVSLIDSPVVAADQSPSTLSTTTSSVPGMAPRPAIVSRAGWGANESWRCTTPKINPTIRAAIVHHTAGTNSYSSSESASIVRGIYAYHVKSLGWCDIGYNFLVDKYGKTFEGRAGGTNLPVHGAHAGSWNTDTVGVSFMGNFETAQPPAVMLEAGAKVIAWKLDGHYRDPLGTVTLAGKKINVISGHGDVMATACPGRNVRSQMAAFRSNVAAKVGSVKTPIQQRWVALGGDAGAAGSPHEPEVAVASGRMTRFTKFDIMWSSATGAKYTAGSIRNKYRALGGPAGRFGFPTTDERAGAPAGSYESLFTGGRIMWTKAGSSQPIVGGIHNAYRRLTLAQQAALGGPLGAEAGGKVADTWRQLFADGGIWWGPQTSGRAVLGPVAKRYLALGGESSRLGLPASDPQVGPVSGSTMSTFQSGYIVSGPKTGARLIVGGIGNSWRALSAATKASLGLPTADEAPARIPSAWRQPFTGGGIWYSYATKGRTVRGAIHTTYVSMGAETSFLKLPTGEAYAVTGGEKQAFQGGWLTRNSKTGVVTATRR
jgi:uncharacterized protein with LGFP repeats